MSKGERQRRAILDGLALLLTTRQIVELTVGEIAAASGVTRSGYYFYFESKYTALAVATSEIMAEMAGRVASFQRLESDTDEVYLRRSADAAADMWRTHEAVLVASRQAISFDEQIAALWKGWNAGLVDTIVAMVVADESRGRADPIIADIGTLVATLLEMTVHMFYCDRLDRNDDEQTDRMIEAVLAVWRATVWAPARDRVDRSDHAARGRRRS